MSSRIIDTPTQQRRVFGTICGILCSIGLGVSVALGRIAFEGGTTPLTVGLSRSVLSIPLLALLCLIAGQSLKLPRAVWPHMIFLGVLFAHMATGNVGATKYIQVSLAALLFFVYPPMVALLNAMIDRNPPGLLKMAAMLIAFLGLAVMLGVEFQTLDPTGVIMGLTAGLACAVNIVLVIRKIPHLHPFVIVFYQSIIASVVLGVLTFQSDEFVLPGLRSGWWAFGLIVALQSFSIPLYYFSIQRIGTEPAAMLNNLQPVASIFCAVILFQEALTTDRILGAMMVLGGILLMQWNDRRRNVTPDRV